MKKDGERPNLPTTAIIYDWTTVFHNLEAYFFSRCPLFTRFLLAIKKDVLKRVSKQTVWHVTPKA